jgi:hypothetical protein
MAGIRYVLGYFVFSDLFDHSLTLWLLVSIFTLFYCLQSEATADLHYFKQTAAKAWSQYLLYFCFAGVQVPAPFIHSLTVIVCFIAGGN